MPRVSILGKNCDVWTGAYSKEGKAFGAVAYGELAYEGNTGEFCVWNGLCLRSTVNGKVQTEATAIAAASSEEVTATVESGATSAKNVAEESKDVDSSAVNVAESAARIEEFVGAFKI